MVTIRPTMTRLPVLAAGRLGAAEIAGEPLAVEVGDDGERAARTAAGDERARPVQPTASRTACGMWSWANLPRVGDVGRPVRAHAWSTRRSHRAEISTMKSDRGSRIVQIRRRVCSIPIRAREQAALEGRPRIDQDRGLYWAIRRSRSWTGDRSGRCGRRHIDGVLGMQLHGGKDLLEPRPVVGSDGGWIVVGRTELDPVAAARGCDGRRCRRSRWPRSVRWRRPRRSAR